MAEPRDDKAAAPEPAPGWVMQGPHANETPPPNPAAPAARSRRGFGLWPLVLLVVVLALVAGSPYWAPQLDALLPWSSAAQNESLAQQLDALGHRLDGLDQHQGEVERRIAALEQQLHGGAEIAQQQQQAALKQIGDRLSALEQKEAQPAPADTEQLKALDQQLQQLAATQAATTDRLGRIEARDTMPAAERTDQALLLALGQLRQAVESGRPYGEALAAVTSLAQGRPELRQALQPLAAQAAEGMPRLAALSRQFQQEVAPAVMRASAAPAADAGWGKRILAKLRTLVVIRHVGADGVASGDPVEAALARTKAALAGGDLAGAVAAVERLPPGPAAAAQPWLASAQQRLAAEQSLDQLTASLTQALTAGAAPAATSGSAH